ncbi:MAG: SDR family NAD(P)-dependent oxidoreductase [Synergistaceae bacterium]|jgi:NAD(P)-dependent dehydrogenase (short-subunit alcohol dehydrogenase family)|nr:SDR family NAD(P)-dependent oxidoreductase [Synergistaceae bacterium]
MEESAKIAFMVGGWDPACMDLCVELANLGYKICFADREGGKEPDSRNGGMNLTGPADLVFPMKEFTAQKISAAIVDTAERFGGIDALVYQYNPRFKPSDADMLLDLDERDWDEAMNSGVKGFFLTCKFILPYLISRPPSVIMVLGAQNPSPAETRLTEYVSIRALDASLEHMSQEVSQYGISIIRRAVGDGANG